MRLWVVVLADVGKITAGVEVAQAGKAPAVDALKPVQQPLDEELGLAVGRSGHDALILIDRHALRIVEQIGRGGEDEPPHTGRGGGLQQVGRVDQIVPQVLERLRHALPDQGIGGEMHDAADVRLVGEKLRQAAPVGQVAFYEGRSWMHRAAVALIEVVQHDHLMPRVDQLRSGDAADVARAAGDQKLHLENSNGVLVMGRVAAAFSPWRGS